MNVTHAITRILKQEGVAWATCFPTNNLIEAVAREGIRPVSFRYERHPLALGATHYHSGDE